MKKVILAAIATGAFLVANGSIASACHIDESSVTTWSENGHTYAIGIGCMTWEETVQWVESFNTTNGLTGEDAWYLTTITSAEENNFVSSLLGNTSGWIGGTDQNVEGSWEWVSGEAFSYTNWHANEPNNLYNEDFLQMYADGTWNDLRDVHTQCSWVVEKGGFSPVPEPATMLLFGSGLMGLSAITRRKK